MNGFEVEMENQRRQSQAAHNVVKLTVEDETGITRNIADTEFFGYDSLSARVVVKSLLVSGKPVIRVSEGSEVEILLDRTPFYAESGGQIADHGFLYVNSDGNQDNVVVEVSDLQKSLKIFVHKGILKIGALEVGKKVEAAVDADLRQRAKVRLNFILYPKMPTASFLFQILHLFFCQLSSSSYGHPFAAISS